jgi:hypothetical protein
MGAQYKVTLAADSPREPLMGAPPPPEAARQRVSDAVTNAKLALHNRERAGAELASPVADHWAQSYATGELAEAMRLLPYLDGETAVGVLIDSIDKVGPGPLPRNAVPPDKQTPSETVEGEGTADGQTQIDRVFLAWVHGFPAVRALEQIGVDAVPHITEALAQPEAAGPPGGPEPPLIREERERRPLLLGEALARIMGRQAAAEHLDAEAASQADEARSTRLRAAARRILPTPP